MDRIDEVTPALHRFTPRVLPAPDASTYLVESFAAAQYRYAVRLTVQLPAPRVAETFAGVVRGTVDALGPDACVVRFSADSASMLLSQVVPIVALGAEFTVDEATPEVATMIAAVGERLTQSFRRRSASGWAS